MPVSLRLGSLGLLLLCACAPVIAQPSRAPGAVLGTPAPAVPQPAAAQLPADGNTESSNAYLSFKLVGCVQSTDSIDCDILVTNKVATDTVRFDIATTRLIDTEGHVVEVAQIAVGNNASVDTGDLRIELPTGVAVRIGLKFKYSSKVEQVALVELGTWPPLGWGKGTFLRVKVNPAKP